MKERLILDGHIHCGPRKFEKNGEVLWNPIERVKKELGEVGGQGAVLLPFPEDIYVKPFASGTSSGVAHEYLLEIHRRDKFFFPFYFVWNDFVIPDNLGEFKGIKWHRHDFDGFIPGDPEYDYSDPRCDRFIDAVREYDLPIIMEEGFEKTKRFCKKYPDLKVIVPHIGSSNDRIGGGRRVIAEFKDFPNVYLETSIAFPMKILSALRQFGPDRLIFGSDAPYSSTKIELLKLLEHPDLRSHLSEEDLDKILSRNMLRLMHSDL